ncbi:hypothetical protein GCG54_00015706 [Colletotrichum gloeosporioides]|uniref:Porphobilinogen deaminase N-terminal domain-containing protein n=1 Tax=Colletotrichum gloeosporioides TaxID=474922 RepID=A0A8H4C760_COLGL|nr:uncharacterized protein GCG54_00015706 [Colletotrichum gloeosporioides]KAF3798383.1 hypothetical protein GCG54_00015706 [Colletotrichum gloeosporioides]
MPASPGIAATIGPRDNGTSWAHALEIGETFRNNRTCLVIKKGNLSGFSIRGAVGSVPAFSIAIGRAAGDADKQTPFIILSKQSGGSDVGKSLWTSDLESDLVGGKTQLLLHSLKDMPITLPPKCHLNAFLGPFQSAEMHLMPSS